MIKLGKLENGFVIFDYVSKTKVFFQTDGSNNVMINFDAIECDVEKNGGFEATRVVGIVRKEEPRLCQLLDELFLLQLCEVKRLCGVLDNPIKGAIIDKFSLYRAPSANVIELTLPSDDDDLDNCTTFGITKNKKAYILTFGRSSKNDKKKNFILKNDGSRVSEMFSIYNGTIQDIKDMPMVGFEYENKDFDMYINDRDQYFMTHLNQYKNYEKMYISHLFNELNDIESYSNGAPNQSNLLNGIKYIRDYVKELDFTINQTNTLFEEEIERVKSKNEKVLQLSRKVDNDYLKVEE